jgi:hypothetical protein
MSWLSSPRTSAMSSTSATPVRGVEAEILPASVFLFQKLTFGLGFNKNLSAPLL